MVKKQTFSILLLGLLALSACSPSKQSEGSNRSEGSGNFPEGSEAAPL